MRTRLALAALLLLVGCSQTDPEGERLDVTVVGTPWPGGLAARLEQEVTLPGLIARDGAGAIIPGLASSWRFVDNDHGLILRLRPIKWSDDSTLGSNEVVSAFRRAAVRGEPALRHGGVAGAAGIAAGTTQANKLGVLAPIARVVEIRLAGASPLLLGWLAEPGLAVTRRDGRATLGAYSATGPAGERVLTRREGMAGPAARPGTIAIVSTNDTTAAVARFARGETDVVIGDGLAGLGDARTVARPQMLQVDPLWGVYGYIANTRSGPLKDPKLRRALSLAIDRTALTARVGLAAMAPVEGLLPPGLAPAVAAAPGMAAQRASAALLRDGKPPLQLTLLLPPGHDHRVIAERVAADWAALGVTLTISEVDAAAIATRIKRGNFDLALTETSLPVADSAALLARWRCDGGLVCDPAADALIDKAHTAPLADRPALIAAAEARWLEAPPMVPLLTPLRWALVARNVEGWTANRAGSHPLGRLAVSAKP